MRRRLNGPSIVLVLLLAGSLAGCPKPEQVAYETVVGSKAFIDKSKAQHPECPAAASAVCTALSKATAAKDTLIDVTETLCAGPNFNTGGACDFPKKGTPGYDQAIAKLNAAVANYNQTATNLKGAL
jgi:hypothetical protein